MIYLTLNEHGTFCLSELIDDETVFSGRLKAARDFDETVKDIFVVVNKINRKCLLLSEEEFNMMFGELIYLDKEFSVVKFNLNDWSVK